MTVDAAFAFFAEEAQVRRSLDVLRQVGLGYLRLGQPATELSGGEAQRIKLATELQRTQRGDTLYVLDEPTTGLHPADVEKLIAQLDGLVESAIPSSWWSMTCASPPAATGSWIWAPVQVTKAVMCWRSARLPRSLDRP
jgi:ABC-type uncharacterized transport system ATPase subunit